MLGEASTAEIAKNRDAQGFRQNRNASVQDGKIAGGARRKLENKSGRKVVSQENFKRLTEQVKRRLPRKSSPKKD